MKKLYETLSKAFVVLLILVVPMISLSQTKPKEEPKKK